MISDITIGKYRFQNRINSVHIESSRKNLADVAVIKLANLSGTLEKQITYGDLVIIQLGYDDRLITEFKGYVKAIKPGIPVEITCEDEMYLLKKAKITPYSWPKTTLKNIIDYIYHGAIATVYDISLSPFRIDSSVKNKAQALDVIKQEYGLDIYFNEKQELYAGLPYQERDDVVVYHFQKNAVMDNLEFRRKEDLSIQIKAISIDNNNHKIEPKDPIGDVGGEVHTLHFYNKTAAELKALAEERLKNMKYDGYRGSFKSKGFPYVHHSMIAKLQDDRYPERAGQYFIDGVTIDYNENDGYTKTITLGRRNDG